MFKYVFSFVTAILLLGITISNAQCEKLNKKHIKNLLGAAVYDNHKTSEVITTADPYVEKYQINLFKGVVYKLIFEASKLPEDAVINLYDIGNKRGAGKYELVFTSENAELTKKGTYEITLEFPKKKMLVVYDVMDNTKPGCVSFVLGYYYKDKY